jgi:hypothetical protein
MYKVPQKLSGSRSNTQKSSREIRTGRRCATPGTCWGSTTSYRALLSAAPLCKKVVHPVRSCRDGGQRVRSSLAAESKRWQSGRKNKQFKLKKNCLVPSTHFKSFSQMKENSINVCKFLNSWLLLGVAIVINRPRCQKAEPCHSVYSSEEQSKALFAVLHSHESCLLNDSSGTK